MNPERQYLFIRCSSGDGRSGLERYARILAQQSDDASYIREVEMDSEGLLLNSGSDAPETIKEAGMLRTLIYQYSPNHHPAHTLKQARKALDHEPDSTEVLLFIHDANHLPEPVDAFFSSALYRRPRSLVRAILPDPVLDGLVAMASDYGARIRFAVFSSHQRQRLPRRLRGHTLWAPHFVERSAPVCERSEAKSRLGLGSKKVMTILGFVDPRKNIELAIESLIHLPPDYVLLIAGGALGGAKNYPEELLKLADKLGVSERVICTGYLSVEKQSECILATDLGLCVFRSVSASGTVSTWISCGVPILARPQKELSVYHDIRPGAIIDVTAENPKVLAGEIVAISEKSLELSRMAMKEIREKLEVPAIWRRLKENLARMRDLDRPSGSQASQIADRCRV